MSKIKKILTKLNVINDKNENSLLLNLTKAPDKEKGVNIPKTTATKENARHQVDLLYLKNDNGYKYLLVAVDVATRKCDAEPLKKRDAITVRDALKKIYKRGILKIPTVDIQADQGSEFKSEFKAYFSKLTDVFYKLTGRSRSQAVIEAKNKQIGTILNTKMLGDEIQNDEPSAEWVKILPKVIKLINEEYSHDPYKVDITKGILVDNKTKDLLPIGTKVRVKLDYPKGYVAGDRLSGKAFRSGDVRWSKEIKTITQVLLNPDQTPLYHVDDNATVAYTKLQLSVVKDNEVLPNAEKEYAQEITDKRKIKGKVEYRVRWEKGETTWELRKDVIGDLKQLIREYEDKQKK